MNIELTEALNRAVEAGTFSLEAVKGIKQLRERVTNIETALKESTDKVTKLEKQLSVEQNEADTIKVQFKAYQAREKELKSREDNVLRNDLEANACRREAVAYQNCLELICKNTIIKKSLMGNAVVALEGHKGQYSDLQPMAESVPIVSEETTKEE